MKKIILTLLFAVSFVVLLSSAKNKDTHFASAKTYVIVPGAWQAPYAWEFVKTGLEKSGNKVIVVELPGHGNDQTPPQDISLDAYRDKVVDVINTVQGKVILVGHSMAGVVIAAVAEKVPAKIEKLVYLAAYVPVSGQNVLDLAGTDTTSLLGQSLRPSADKLTVDVLQDKITESFIQDGSDDVKKLVLSHYRAEPGIPFTNKVTLSAANYGSVPKVYIETLLDQTVTNKLQKRMLAAVPFKTVYSLNTGHCPFLSKPDELTALLKKIAKN